MGQKENPSKELSTKKMKIWSFLVVFSCASEAYRTAAQVKQEIQRLRSQVDQMIALL